MTKTKKELEQELEKRDILLKDILFSLNQIRNTKVSGKFADTYSICTAIGKIVNK